jgi:hypothetical protein
LHLYAKHKDEEQREEISGPIIPELIFHARHEIIELPDRRKTLAQAVCELKGEQVPDRDHRNTAWAPNLYQSLKDFLSRPLRSFVLENRLCSDVWCASFFVLGVLLAGFAVREFR